MKRRIASIGIVLVSALLISGIVVWADGVTPPWIKNHRLLPGGKYQETVFLSLSEPGRVLWDCPMRSWGSKPGELPLQTEWLDVKPEVGTQFETAGLHPFTVTIDVPEDATLGVYHGAIEPVLCDASSDGGVGVCVGAGIDVELGVTTTKYSEFHLHSARQPGVPRKGWPVRVGAKLKSRANVTNVLTATLDCRDTAVQATESVLLDPFETGRKYFNFPVYAPRGSYPATLTIVNQQGMKESGSLYLHIRNNPPYPPSNPSPADSAVRVSPATTLLWESRDRDGDPLSYDVYLEAADRTPDHLICDDVVASQCQPPKLSYGTHYYWQVIATDTGADLYRGASTAGEVWEFETLSATPVVEAGCDQVVEEGETLELAPATFTDPDDGDGHTASVDWGNASLKDAAVDQRANAVSGSHIYGDDGAHQVEVCVTDGDGNTGCDSLSVTVQNVPPTVSFQEAQGPSHPNGAIWAGDPLAFTAVFTDSGWLDTHVSEWQYDAEVTGPGVLTEENSRPAATGGTRGEYTYYRRGKYTVQLEVTDDDGGVGRADFPITVAPIPATIDCDPDTLNLKASGRWMTCYMELPQGYEAGSIDGAAVRLNGSVSAHLGKQGWATADGNKENLADYDRDGRLERMVKFSTADVQATVGDEAEQRLTVDGKVFHNGGAADFEGHDSITVIQPAPAPTGTQTPWGH